MGASVGTLAAVVTGTGPGRRLSNQARERALDSRLARHTQAQGAVVHMPPLVLVPCPGCILAMTCFVASRENGKLRFRWQIGQRV